MYVNATTKTSKPFHLQFLLEPGNREPHSQSSFESHSRQSPVPSHGRPLELLHDPRPTEGTGFSGATSRAGELI